MTAPMPPSPPSPPGPARPRRIVEALHALDVAYERAMGDVEAWRRNVLPRRGCAPTALLPAVVDDRTIPLTALAALADLQAAGTARMPRIPRVPTSEEGVHRG